MGADENRRPPPVGLDDAVRIHRAGRLAEAAAIYRAILTAQPDQPDARHLLGVAFRQSGHAGVAARLIGQALALNPDFADAYLNRGLAMAAARPAEAALCYRRALRLRPDFATARDLLRGPLRGEDGWDWTTRVDDDVVVYAAPGMATDPAALDRLLGRLRTEPQADVVFQEQGQEQSRPLPLPDGPCPAGLWLAQQLDRRGMVEPPTLAVLRRSFVERGLTVCALPDGTAGPPGRAVWGLIAATARMVRVTAHDAPTPQAAERNGGRPGISPPPLDDEAVSLLVWLRRSLGQVADDPVTARMLRRALTVRLLDATWTSPPERLARWFSERSPVPVLRRLLAALPTKGTARMARAVLRLTLPAAAAAITARARPPAVRSVHGLQRRARGILPHYAIGGSDDLAEQWDGWCYLGQDPQQMAELADGPLRALPRTPIEHHLRQTALRHRADFGAAWDGLLNERPNRWALMVAEQSPDTSLLFLHACCVLTALDLFLSDAETIGSVTGRLLIVVEQPALFQVIADLVLPAQASRPWPDLEADLAENGWRLLRHYSRAARNRRLNLTALAAARAALQAERPDTPAPRTDADVLLVTYLDAQGIGTDGRWRDRYFGALPDWLRARGLTVQWLWFDWTQRIPADRLVRLAEEPGLLCQELAGWTGVVAATLEKINAWRDAPRMRLSVAGRDLTSLLRLELRWSITNPIDIDRLLFRRVGPALAKRGARIGRILYPYENQGWEKMLCAGVRRALPDTRLIGYLHASFSPFYLGYYPLSAHWASARRPHQVVALSTPVAAHLVESGYPADAVVASGALRYDYLFDEDASNHPPAHNTATPVLAILPNGPPDARAMFRLLVAALGGRPERPVRLKLHPATVHRVALLLHPLPPHFTIIGGSMADALADCSVAIYCIGTAGLEILAAGTPLIAMAPTGRFSYLSLPAGGPLAYIDTADELRAQVERYATLDPDQRQTLARQARALALWWFSPPQPEQADDFLG